MNTQTSPQKNVHFYTHCAEAEQAGFRPYKKCKPDQRDAAKGKHRAKAGEKIQFAIDDSSLGSVLVAQSDQGLCAVLLGNNPYELKRDLQDRFPNATVTEEDSKCEKQLSEVIKFVEDPSCNLDVILDLRGTDFQQRVWKTLFEIPTGATASYSDIAKKMGLPKAVRAVAKACAANALAVIIPCHRVLRSDGTLSGYRWGVERKKILLQREKAGLREFSVLLD